MDLTYDDLEDGIRRITLKGRLDLEGSGAIDLKFTALTTTEKFLVVVDLTDVEFMASIGLGTLVRNAKAVRLRGGHMVVLNPRQNVTAVFASTRIDQVIPVCRTLEEARTQLRRPPTAAM
jgi:anti-sigma B factor antagonist